MHDSLLLQCASVGPYVALYPVTMKNNQFAISELPPRARKLLRFCLNGANAQQALELAQPVTNNWGEVSIPRSNMDRLYAMISADTGEVAHERGMAIVWLAEAIRGERDMAATVELAWTGIDTQLDNIARVQAGEDVQRGW